MILNERKEGSHYLAVKKLFALHRGMTSKHDGDFYCLNYLHSFRTEIKLKFHEKVCKNKDFFGTVMSSENDNILEFNQYMKPGKMPNIIHADLDSLIKNIDGCANNPEKSSTKIGKHITCGHSMSAIWTFNYIENKHTLYCREDCMKKFCEYLRDHVKNIIGIENEKILPLTKEELKSHQDVKVCYICGHRILQKLPKNKNYQKVRDHCHSTGKYRGAAHSICNLKFNVPNETPVVFHNASNYDYHFSIKEFANEFEGNFNVLGKIRKSAKPFSLPTEKEVTEITKDGNESVVIISYKTRFIDSARFMATSLSSLVDNITEGIYKVECKDCECLF